MKLYQKSLRTVFHAPPSISLCFAGIEIFQAFIISSSSHAHDKTKNLFLYFFTKLKTYHLSYSI